MPTLTPVLAPALAGSAAMARAARRAVMVSVSVFWGIENLNAVGRGGVALHRIRGGSHADRRNAGEASCARPDRSADRLPDACARASRAYAVARAPVAQLDRAADF